jgi:hypothetical protein
MQARAGAQPAGTQASHTLFMSSTVRMSDSQMVARRSLVLSVPAFATNVVTDDRGWSYVTLWLPTRLSEHQSSSYEPRPPAPDRPEHISYFLPVIHQIGEGRRRTRASGLDLLNQLGAKAREFLIGDGS